MMPILPKHPCANRGCPELTSRRLCQKHEQIIMRQLESGSLLPYRGGDEWGDGEWDDGSRFASRRQGLKRNQRQTFPLLAKPAIPVTIICGPPGSGKSSWVKSQAKPGDWTIDFDEIVSRLSELPLYAAGPEWIQPAIYERTRMLSALSRATKGMAYFIVSGPLRAQRQKWKEILGAQRVVVFETPASICRERILADDRRGDAKSRHLSVVEEWWRMYERDPVDVIER